MVADLDKPKVTFKSKFNRPEIEYSVDTNSANKNMKKIRTQRYYELKS